MRAYQTLGALTLEAHNSACEKIAIKWRIGKDGYITIHQGSDTLRLSVTQLSELSSHTPALIADVSGVTARS